MVEYTLHLVGPDGKGLIEEIEIFQSQPWKAGICLVNHLKSGKREIKCSAPNDHDPLKLSSCFLHTHKFDDVSSVLLHNCKCGTAEKRLKI